jgi:hypothetical protein
MLFNLRDDPHEQRDLAESQPEVVGRAMTMLDEWHAAMMRTSTTGIDPMWTVLREGGAFHTRRQLPGYIARLRETGRAKWAEHLATRYARECT